MAQINLSLQNKSLWTWFNPKTNLHQLANSQSTNQLPLKLAALDLDSTLVVPKSGAKFSVDGQDWQWAFPQVPTILQTLEADGYVLLIFSNQKGIKKGQTNPVHLSEKLSAIQAELSHDGGIGFSAVMMAGDDDYYRKPRLGMWHFLVDQLRQGYWSGCGESGWGEQRPTKKRLPIDLMKQLNWEQSFYCGDAAGRPKGWHPGARADFSRGDLYFAQNLGLPFQLPEQLFLEEHANLDSILKEHPCPVGKGDPYIEQPELQWEQYVSSSDELKKYFLGNLAQATNEEKELVMFIGLPASGKSTFGHYYADRGYEIINMDTLKTKAKCLKATRAAIAIGKNIVIDNTNPSVTNRGEYLSLVAGHGYRCLAYRMQTPAWVYQHLNHFRVQLRGRLAREKNDPSLLVNKIPMVAYRMCASKMVEPTVEEGFDLIGTVPFCLIWETLPDEQARREFYYHYEL